MQISDNHFTHVYRPNQQLLLRELEYERVAKERAAERGVPTGRPVPIHRLAALFSRAPRATAPALGPSDTSVSCC